MDRKCIVCGFEGDEELFALHVAVRADGTRRKTRQNKCKKCVSKQAYAAKLAKKETDPCKYYADSTWKTLNQRCANGKWANSPAVQRAPQMISYHKKQILLQITQDELKQFWKDNEKLVKEILAAGGTPSIDRIDDSGHYTLSNMQILERKANIQKSRGITNKLITETKEERRLINKQQYNKAVKSKKEN